MRLSLIGLAQSWGVPVLPGTSLLSYCLDERQLMARVGLSGSLVDANADVDGWRAYRDGASIPGSAWRTLTASDLAPAPPICAPGDFIGLVRFSPPAVSMLRSLLPEVKAKDSPARKQCVEVITSELHPGFTQTGVALFAGLTRLPPRLQTGTIDSVTGLRTGLHLDSWECEELSGRHAARNRIAINLGRTSRRFLFIAGSVESLPHHLETSLNECLPVDEGLLEATSGLPRSVYALTIEPGEAYIAPTECLVHDGATNAGETADISLAVRLAIMPATCA